MDDYSIATTTPIISVKNKMTRLNQSRRQQRRRCQPCVKFERPDQVDDHRWWSRTLHRNRCPPSQYVHRQTTLTLILSLTLSSSSSSLPRLSHSVHSWASWRSIPQPWRTRQADDIATTSQVNPANRTIRYGRLTCAQKLTGWPALSKARPRNEKIRENIKKTE